MHDRFGAEVRVRHSEGGDRQLFLVRGASVAVPIAGYVRSRGGNVVMEGANWLLAEMAVPQAQALRREAGILAVGGVHVDPERFTQFQKLLKGPGIPLD